MPRSKSQPAHTERAVINHENVAADTRAMDADAPRRLEIIERYGDGTPYDRLRVVNEIRFYTAQGAMAMLEAGRRLVQIKEFEEHGDFLTIVDGLGISPRTAQRMMGAAVKYLVPLPAEGKQKLLALSPTKLYDLAILDDEEIKELAKGKTVAGMTLDEIDSMGSHELRAKLREAGQQLEAKDKVLEQKNKKIDRLLEQDHQRPAWQKAFDHTIKEISEKGDALMRACADLAVLAESIASLELEGVEREGDLLALRAQLANRYYDLSDHLLEQSVGLFVGARSEYIEGLLSLARKKLPEDVKAKIFGGES